MNIEEFQSNLKNICGASTIISIGLNLIIARLGFGKLLIFILNAIAFLFIFLGLKKNIHLNETGQKVSHRWKKNELLKISLTEFLFPTIFINGFFNSNINSQFINFSLYMFLMFLYHNGEFFFVLYCHPAEVCWDSKKFLI